MKNDPFIHIYPAVLSLLAVVKELKNPVVSQLLGFLTYQRRTVSFCNPHSNAAVGKESSHFFFFSPIELRKDGWNEIDMILLELYELNIPPSSSDKAHQQRSKMNTRRQKHNVALD